jgi:hypothetical protein
MMNTHFKKGGCIFIFSCVLLLSIMFSIQKCAVAAGPEAVLEIEPQTSYAPPGKTFSFNITIVDVADLYGVEVNLHWNASILQMVNVNATLGVETHPNGTLYEPVTKYQDQIVQEQGKYTLAGSSVSPASSFNGTGTIATVTFNVTGFGSCELVLEAELASNIIPEGSTSVAPIPHATVNGFFGPFQLFAYPTTVNVGDNIIINGSVALVQANTSVGIYSRRIEETSWHLLNNVATNEAGVFSYTWKPQESGSYYVQVSAMILGSERETSSSISIVVKEPNPAIWPYLGFSVSIILIVAVSLLILMHRGAKKRKRP